MSGAGSEGERRAVRVLFACVFVVMTGYGITLTVLPYYVDRVHGLSGLSNDTIAFHVGSLTSAYALAQLAASPVAGRLGDRIGRRPVLVVGLAGMALTQALFGFVPWLWALYLLRLLGGAAASGMLVAATAFVADMTSLEERTRGMAWFGTSVSLGLVAGPVLGGLLSRPGFSIGRAGVRLDGYSLPFLAAAVLALAVLAVAVRVLPESRDGTMGAETSGEAQAAGRAGRLGLRQLLGLVVFSQFGLALFEGTFVLYGRDRLALSAVKASVAFMVCGLVMAVLQPIATGALARMAAPLAQVASGLVLMGVGIGAVVTTTRYGVALAWIGVFAAGTALVIPNLSALISIHGADRAGAALGLKNAASSAGQFAGPLIGVMLIGWRETSPFLVSAGTLLAVGITVGIGAASTARQSDTVAGAAEEAIRVKADE